MVLELQRGGHEVDRKLDAGKIQLFKGSEPMLGSATEYDDEAMSSSDAGGGHNH